MHTYTGCPVFYLPTLPQVLHTQTSLNLLLLPVSIQYLSWQRVSRFIIFSVEQCYELSSSLFTKWPSLIYFRKWCISTESIFSLIMGVGVGSTFTLGIPNRKVLCISDSFFMTYLYIPPIFWSSFLRSLVETSEWITSNSTTNPYVKTQGN